MYRRFHFIENSLSGLEQKVTEYILFDECNLVLDSYYESSRPTKRHKFVIGNRWSRLNRRERNIEKPIIRDEVKEAILKEARDAIHFAELKR